MSEIDAEKLERAIAQACNHGPMQGGLAGGTFTSTTTHVLYTLIDAARAHLATLPRWKEVEIEAFAVVGSDGELAEVWLVQENARLDAEEMNGTVVRLTGTAKVKVKP